jgi:hypothetical protein
LELVGALEEVLVEKIAYKINPLVKLVGATSGLMILAIAGSAVYLGLNSVQP